MPNSLERPLMEEHYSSSIEKLDPRCAHCRHSGTPLQYRNRWLLLSAIALILGGLLGSGITIELRRSTSSAAELRGPEFPKRLVTFRKDPAYMGALSKSQPAWNTLLDVANSGQIAFDASSPNTRYGISAYHQTHCVYMMQKAVDMAVDGKQLQDEQMVKHMWHCAEYLRQSVMCHADSTIERTFKGVLGAFEANNTHMCGDWDALMQWADKIKWTGDD